MSGLVAAFSGGKDSTAILPVCEKSSSLAECRRASISFRSPALKTKQNTGRAESARSDKRRTTMSDFDDMFIERLWESD